MGIKVYLFCRYCFALLGLVGQRGVWVQGIKVYLVYKGYFATGVTCLSHVALLISGLLTPKRQVVAYAGATHSGILLQYAPKCR